MPVRAPATADLIMANDKLLKALIVLLALREDGLLDELRAVFAVAAMEGSPIGRGAESVWRHIREELALISELVEGEDEAAEAEPAAPQQGPDRA